jgi:YD repeat-containing protein
VVDTNGTTTYEYDAMHRLTGVTYHDDEEQTYQRGAARSQRLPRLTPLRVIGGVLILGVLGLVSAYLLVWGLFSWCTPHFDRSDLVGVYERKYPSGTERLELREDGTFLQEVILKDPQDSTPVARTGTWTFDEQPQIVRIPGCMPVYGAGGINPTFRTDLSDCALPVERQGIFFGPITLSGDANIALRKVD